MSDDAPGLSNDLLSPLVKAASEPDLTALPHTSSDGLLPPFPLLPLPPPALQIPEAPPSPPFLSPRASPRSSPRSSPRGSPRSRGPAPTPTFTSQPAPEHTVSFSEYVASELARDQTSAFGVTFAAAAEVSTQPLPTIGFSFVPSERESLASAPSSPPPPQPQSGPILPDGNDGGDGKLPGEFDDGHKLPGRGPLQDLHLDALDPHPEPVFQAGSAGRYGKLACIQLDDKAQIMDRELSRAEILQEARDTLSKSQPSPKAIGRWLSNAATGQQSPSPELREFTSMLGSGANSRKATQKALRDYLRNSLQARDIRQVDPAFVAKPALWVRHSALVVSLEGLRAIILHNKMFLFDPTNDRTRQLVFIAKQSVLARPDAENPQPFEFKALEGILIFLAMGLEREFGALKPEIEMYLHQLPNELTTKMLEELRLKKQQLNHFHSRASNVKTILENLLDEDEEMANMYLTEKHTANNGGRSAVDHSEIETLLEAYLQVIDEHVNHSTLLNDAIDDTEDLVMIHLDTLRNRLLSVELALSVVSMTFGVGGVVSGMFGMNIQIPLFEATASKMWFLVVVSVILVTVVVVSWLVLIALRRRGLYSFY